MDAASQGAVAGDAPAIPPPNGVVADFSAPNPLRTLILAITSVFMGFAFLFVAVRVYTKAHVMKNWSWDDVTYTVGVMCMVSNWVIFLIAVVDENWGQHFWNVPYLLAQSDNFGRLAFAAAFMDNLAFLFIKLTFFIMYWNIFNIIRPTRFAIIVGAMANTVYYSAVVLSSIIRLCPSPHESWFQRLSQSSKVVDYRMVVATGAWNTLSDLYILMLPTIGVLRMQLSLKKKLEALGLLATGFGVCICSAFSLYFRTLVKSPDITYAPARVELLVAVELSVGACIACVPTASRLVRHISSTRTGSPQFQISHNAQSPTPASPREQKWPSQSEWTSVDDGV